MSNSRPEPKITQAIIKAASKLLAETTSTEQEVFETLPNGNRISIEIAILPPVDDEATGAMRTRPDAATQRLSA